MTCLRTDLVHIQMLMRLVLLKTNLYRANRIMDQNGKMEQVGKAEGRAQGHQDLTWPFQPAESLSSFVLESEL